MTTKEAMKQVLAREPNLSLYGYKDDFSWGPYSKRRGEPDAERFRRDREAMLGDRALQEFECACDWLDAQARTKNPNQRIGSSYTLKHMAEKEVETGYLPNGVFIAAAIVRCVSGLSAPSDIAETTKRARIDSIDSTSSRGIGVADLKLSRSRSTVARSSRRVLRIMERQKVKQTWRNHPLSRG